MNFLNETQTPQGDTASTVPDPQVAAPAAQDQTAGLGSVPAPATNPAAAPNAAAAPVTNALPNQAFDAPPVPPVPVVDNSFWVKLIIFLNPLASIIFFLIHREKDEERAKKALGTGWFAVVFWTIAIFALFALYFVMMAFFLFIAIATTATHGGSSW